MERRTSSHSSRSSSRSRWPRSRSPSPSIPKRQSSFEEFPDVGPRRPHALDAVRAFALLAGIVLHATMSFFLPIPAHDVSQSATLGVLFFEIHTWRMTMFFVVAGLFARLVVARRGTRGFVADRSKRILVPLLVGWIIPRHSRSAR